MSDATRAPHSTGFVSRLVRAALLEPSLYEEVEADRGATGQACAVVLLSAIAAGIGGLERHGLGALVLYTVAATVGWVAWAYAAYLIGTRLLPGAGTRSDPGELLRTLGFSSAPGVLRLFALVPMIGAPVFLASTLWMLVAMVVAVRHALDYPTTGRALAVCALGFPVYAGTLALSLLLLGPWPS